MWSIIYICPTKFRVLSLEIRFEISIVGSLIERRPPSLKEKICFPIREPPSEFTPESHALYSKKPENRYLFPGPSNKKFVMGG
jgi:hypothetical protein